MAEWPLVGRAGELARLGVLLTDRGRRGVMVAGGAGVGKTRLAMEGLRLADRGGLATMQVTATRSAAGLPLGALAGLLPEHSHGEKGAVDDRADLLGRSAAALVERAAGRPLVLFVDDAHLLDDTSATLVHQLAVTGAAFVMATIRSGESAPDPVVSLWKDGLVERIELGGLPAEGVEELLSVALAGPVDPAASMELAVRCQGNVLYLRELVLGALDDGTLRNDGGIWRLVGPLAPSDRLVELVEARLGSLDGAERALLELVSFGEPLGTAELNVLSDPALAEDLERRGLLSSRLDGRRLEIRLAHPVYGDVLRRRIPALRVRTLTRSLAEAVEATGARRRADILRVATWRLTGGGGRPELMLAAATIARWRYDFPLAERLARAALEAGAGFDAALLAAQLAGLQGRGTESAAALAELAGKAANNTQRGRVAVTRLENYLYLGRRDEFLQLAEEAEASIADPAWRDEITARQSWVILATQGPRAAAKAAEPLLEKAAGPPSVWAHRIAAASLARLGRLDAAIDTADQGYVAQLTLTIPMPWYPWEHLSNRGLALAYAGRLEEAEVLAAGQYQQAIADNSVEAQVAFALRFAQLADTRGRVKTAAHHAREAVALSRQLGRPMVTSLALQSLALALALAGQPQEAADALTELDALKLPPCLIAVVDLIPARAWTAVAAGNLPQARQLLENGAAAGEAIGDLVGAAACLHGLARLGHAKDVASRLTALAANIDGQLASARATHTQALASGDPTGLYQVSTAFEAMGADLLAAEAAADAAVAWKRAGDPRQSAYAERRAASLADRCEGPTTPALQAIDARAQLAPAERETALLAASRRSNKQIAEELCLSVRTVENRLQRVYEKLGINGRAELTTALQPENGKATSGPGDTKVADPLGNQ